MDLGLHLVTLTAQDAAGNATKCLATVEVVAPLAVITQAPASTTNELCGPVALTVVASAPVPLAYQWYQFGTNAVAGGTNATLTLAGATAEQAGEYVVVVTEVPGA